jgi:hypothetical protein
MGAPGKGVLPRGEDGEHLGEVGRPEHDSHCLAFHAGEIEVQARVVGGATEIEQQAQAGRGEEGDAAEIDDQSRRLLGQLCGEERGRPAEAASISPTTETTTTSGAGSWARSSATAGPDPLSVPLCAVTASPHDVGCL